MNHDWITTLALPGRSYDVCTHCDVKAIRWYVDGEWLMRVRGPKECGGRNQ